MANYDPVAFAKWLNEAFEKSSFKSFSALADSAKLQRSTVSALVNAKLQTLTGKASQPKPETVISLATVLNEDVDKALLLAGHAPKNNSEIPKSIAAIGFKDLTEEDAEKVASYIQFLKAQRGK